MAKKVTWYPTDNKITQLEKTMYARLITVFELKDCNLWYDDDEKDFVKSFGFSTDDRKTELLYKKLEDKI